MQTKGYFSYVFITICLFIGGCTYDNEIDLYGTTECITEQMSYQDDILPIISENCYQCHSAAQNFGNVTIEGFDAFTVYVDNGSIIGSITHAPGFSPMPKNRAKLIDCEIEKVMAWIEQGALNN